MLKPLTELQKAAIIANDEATVHFRRRRLQISRQTEAGEPISGFVF